ncbi:ABC transporter permease [Neisseria sicca]|uniref:ABC transporter permease n=1 Tax=Neisseria sicca TaxID=490 RepID=UPI000A564C04|nr:ABC transporter permease [Neisseria sicca]
MRGILSCCWISVCLMGSERDGGYWAGAYGNIQLDCLPQQAGGFVVFEKMRKLFLRVIVILVLGRLNIIGTAS